MQSQTHYTIIASPTKATISYNNRTTFVWNTEGEVIAASAILPFLGIVLVELRFYNRFKYKAGFHPEHVYLERVFPILIANVSVKAPSEEPSINKIRLQK